VVPCASVRRDTLEYRGDIGDDLLLVLGSFKVHSASAILGHHLNPNGDHHSVLDLIVYRWIHHLSSALNLRASRPRLVLEIFMFLRHRQRIRMTISCSRRWKTPCRQRMMGRGPSRILLMLSAAFKSRLTNL